MKVFEHTNLFGVYLKISKAPFGEFRFPQFIIYPFIPHLERDRHKKKLVEATN
jgi:hypothetical protein